MNKKEGTISRQSGATDNNVNPGSNRKLRARYDVKLMNWQKNGGG